MTTFDYEHTISYLLETDMYKCLLASRTFCKYFPFAFFCKRAKEPFKTPGLLIMVYYFLIIILNIFWVLFLHFKGFLNLFSKAKEANYKTFHQKGSRISNVQTFLSSNVSTTPIRQCFFYNVYLSAVQH